MAVPKRKTSRQRRDKRFANKGLEVQSFTTCSNCSAALMPHSACKGCGFYKGKKVLISKDDRSVKRDEIKKQKEAKAAANASVEATAMEKGD
ncbi:50S ribosomal protein L32 [candidate division TM6 bacterium RIFCSPHIGHO2_12_FULL_36_22]|nr:MAG: 50S ribosomal protein L32 [candidate division TM6 bacterium RIFCSPHIGHO2_12_FULL_36_22]